MKTKTKICKGCGKVMPEGYKHKYCEACRTKHAHAAKNTLYGCLGVAITAVAVLTKGKINLKK